MVSSPVTSYQFDFHPLGHETPGEKYDFEDQPDGRHRRGSPGPKCPQLETPFDQLDWSIHRSVRHSLGGVKTVVNGKGCSVAVVENAVADMVKWVPLANRPNVCRG